MPPHLATDVSALPGEPPYDVCPADHDIEGRAAREGADAGLVLVSLSSPLGLEDLAHDDAGLLLEIWHACAAELPAPFGACETDPKGAPCVDAVANIQNPFYLGDQPGGTQVSGWLDAWTPAPSAYAVKAMATTNWAPINTARTLASSCPPPGARADARTGAGSNRDKIRAG